jgi:DNA-binding NarL/FixJ family response regulator
MGASVVIVDDHAGFRAHARRCLEGEGYRVVGEAADCAGGLAAAARLAPDFVLVDVHLPDADGFELTERIGELPAAPDVVLTSSHDRSEMERCIEESGARGFVPKASLCRATIDELLPHQGGDA